MQLRFERLEPRRRQLRVQADGFVSRCRKRCWNDSACTDATGAAWGNVARQPTEVTGRTGSGGEMPVTRNDTTMMPTIMRWRSVIAA
jgi:hypothetical protein